jgi:hypothetical protein
MYPRSCVSCVIVLLAASKEPSDRETACDCAHVDSAAIPTTTNTMSNTDANFIPRCSLRDQRVRAPSRPDSQDGIDPDFNIQIDEFTVTPQI